MSKRRTRSPAFKAKVAMKAISGRRTIEAIAADHAINLHVQRTSRCELIQVSEWKRQLLAGASELFTRGMKTKVKEQGQAKEAELFQQIGQQIGWLQMELEWLKTKSQLL